MKKAFIIIFAVAILGLLGAYVKNSDKNQSPAAAGISTTNPTSSTSSSAQSGNFKNGTFTGNVAETPYGSVQVAAVISGGKITDIQFLRMPDGEDRSRQITSDSEPQLKQAAIDAQSSQIDFVTGATSTSYGYQESLQAALDQAKNS